MHMSQFTFRINKKRVGIYLAIIAAIYAVLFIIVIAIGDYELTLAINQWQTTFPTWFRDLAKFYTKYGYYIFGITGIVVALLSFYSPKFEKLKPYRVMFLGLVYGFVVSWCFTEVLKILVGRVRPFVQHEGDFDTYGVGDSYSSLPRSNESFPSGHANSAFGMSGALMARVKNWGWRILFYAYAITMAFSRPFFGVHYVTDILAGSLIGLACSLGFYVFFEYINAKGKLSEKTQKILFLGALVLAFVSIIISLLE